MCLHAKYVHLAELLGPSHSASRANHLAATVSYTCSWPWRLCRGVAVPDARRPTYALFSCCLFIFALPQLVLSGKRSVLGVLQNIACLSFDVLVTTATSHPGLNDCFVMLPLGPVLLSCPRPGCSPIPQHPGDSVST